MHPLKDPAIFQLLLAENRSRSVPIVGPPMVQCLFPDADFREQWKAALRNCRIRFGAHPTSIVTRLYKAKKGPAPPLISCPQHGPIPPPPPPKDEACPDCKLHPSREEQCHSCNNLAASSHHSQPSDDTGEWRGDPCVPGHGGNQEEGV